MKVQLFINNNLAIHLYYSKESIVDHLLVIDELIIFFPGLPQFIDKRFFEKKVSQNTAFMSIYYYGTWLSGGEFLPTTIYTTVSDAINFAKSGKCTTSFDGSNFEWKYNRCKVIGCSFSGNSILNGSIKKNDVSLIELYNPLIYLENTDISNIPGFDKLKFNDVNRNFLFFVRNGYANVLRGINSSAWDNYFFGSDINSRIILSDETPIIKIYQALDDVTINPNWSKHFCEQNKQKAEYIPINNSEHDFISLYNKVNGYKKN